MKNMAYNEDYIKYRQEQESVFQISYLQKEETIILSQKYTLIRRFYCEEVEKYTLHATENQLFNEEKELLFTWRNLDDNGEFCKILTHNDGNKYMIFRSDLYGYSVLNLNSMQEFHYIPSDSFPKGETFIWKDVFYNDKNNMIAVLGCYCASSFGTLLLDFSYPMKEASIWADVQKHIEDGYDKYDDVEFMGWHGTDLVLGAFNSETEQKEIISISEDRYIKWV